MREGTPMSQRLTKMLRLPGSLSVSRSLTTRLLLYFALLAVLPLAVVGALTYYEARATLKEDVLDHLTTVVILKEQEINRWVSETVQDVQLLAAGPSLQQLAGVLLADPAAGTVEAATAYEELRTYFEQVLAQEPDFAEILVVEAAGGNVVLSTNRAHEGASEVTSPFFAGGSKATYVQNVYSSPSLGKPTITVATPLVGGGEPLSLARDGETIGVLAVNLDLARLDAIVQERGALGRAVETYVVDPLGAMVSWDNVRREAFSGDLHTQAIDAVLLRREDGAGVYDNYRGVPVVGVYHWLDERDIALLVEIRLRAAMAPARQLALSLLLIGISAALVVGIIAYGVTRGVSRPILQLAEVSAEMADGNLDRAVTLDREDEIGVLANALGRMASQLRDLIGGLEQGVAERTRDLRHRAVQLETAVDVGRAAASVLDLDSLLPRVVELVRERFGFYYVGLFLLDEAGGDALLAAGSGEAGRTMKEEGHHLAVGGQSMVGQACSARQARIALDVGVEPARFDNPLLPDTRSEAALPLTIGDRVLGALDVQSTEPAAFSEADIAVLQLVADQVAVAVDNALKVSQEARLLEATSPLYRTSYQLAAASTVEEVSEAVLSAVAETEADGCSVAHFHWAPDGEIEAVEALGRWERTSATQEPLAPEPAAWHELLPLPLLTQLNTIEDVLQDGLISDEGRKELRRLGIHALVVVPLRTASSGRGQGFLLIDRHTPGGFSAVTLRRYEALAQQAAVALEKAQLLEESQQQAWREHHIRDIGDRIASSFDLEQLMETTISELGTMIGAAEGYVEMAVPSQAPGVKRPLADGKEGEEET
jgi:GAF domain-containing protein/HAMP domain-containing protein